MNDGNLCVNPELLALLQKGEMTTNAFQQFLTQLERKTVPTELRAEIRLCELKEHLVRMNHENHLGTRTECDNMRKVARNGLRIAKRFRNDWFTRFFEVLHSTFVMHLAGMDASEK